MNDNILISKVPVARGSLAGPRNGKRTTWLKHRGREKVVLEK